MKSFLSLLLCLGVCGVVSASDVVTKTATVDGQQYAKLTNLPTIYINTGTGSDPSDRVTYLACTIVWVDTDSTTTYVISDAEHGIKGRGNTTWGASKKPWRIKFNDKQKFLGKGYAKAKSWVFLANTYDKSLMRNAITSYLGKKCGLDYNPAVKFVDLVMNGTYRGTYQISDQIDVDEHRVQAVDENGEYIDSQNKLTWLIEYCNSSDKVDEPMFTMSVNGSNYGYYQIKNPDQDYDESTGTYTIDENITNYVNSTWAPLLMTGKTGSAYSNPYSGYRSENDEESLINWYVATEITANWDGLYSINMYRYPGNGDDIPASRMFWGPMWDYDLAYGNHTETYDRTYFSKQDFYTKLLCENNFVQSQVSENSYRRFQPLIKHMWDDPWFAVNVQHRLNEIIDDGLETYLLNKIESMRTELAESAAKNFAKWSLTSVDRGYAYYTFGSTWTAQVDALKNFISSRISTVKKLVDNKNTSARNRYFLEKETNSVATESSVNVVLKRTANANQWTTVCLPVALGSAVIADWFGADAKVYEFAGTETSGEQTVLNFTGVTAMKAGVPYLVMPSREMKVDYTFLSTSTTGSPSLVSDGSYDFTGVYSPSVFDDSSTRLYLDGGKLMIGSGSQFSIDGMRAYISVPDDVDLTGLSVNIDGEVLTPYVFGDLNYDLVFDTFDVKALVNYILGRRPVRFNSAAADINGDGKVNMVDVTLLIDRLKNK